METRQRSHTYEIDLGERCSVVTAHLTDFSIDEADYIINGTTLRTFDVGCLMVAQLLKEGSI